jgi:hypothetical protein
MGNSISLNFLADDAHHLTVNSQRRAPGTPSLNSNAPFSPRSDFSSEVTGALSASPSDSSLHSIQEGHSAGTGGSCGSPKSPVPKTRQCWICYGEEEIQDVPEFAAKWVSPCSCKGTTKWVHQACLLDWIDSQVMNNATLAANRLASPHPNNNNATNTTNSTSPFTTPLLNTTTPTLSNALPAPRFQAGDGPLVLESVKLTCPQCHAPYRISEAHALPRRVLLLIDSLAKAKERLLMWSTLGLVSGSIYTVAFSYGLFSGWMVGGSEYLEFIRNAFDPLQGSVINRLQISAGIPLMPLFALSSAFSMFSWTFPLVPIFILDGRHRVSLTQPRGILLFLPLIWSTHQVITNSLLPAIYKRLTATNNAIEDEASEYEEEDISVPAGSNDSMTSSSEYSSEASPGASTVKISILSTTAALLFPSIAALTGWALVSLLPKSFGGGSKVSPFYRSLIGAGILVAFKDLSRLLYWYQTVKLRKYRRVLNQTDN